MRILFNHPSRSGAGFTLMELMVVLVIIGVVSAVILPEMTGTYDESKLRTSARQLIQTMGLAQSRAVAVNHEHRLVIDNENHRFWMARRSLDEGLGETFVPVDEISGAEGTWYPRVEVTFRNPLFSEDDEQTEMDPWKEENETKDPSEMGSKPFMTFYPDGTTSRAEWVLKHSNGTGLVLKVLPATGRVRIQQLENEF